MKVENLYDEVGSTWLHNELFISPMYAGTIIIILMLLFYLRNTA